MVSRIGSAWSVGVPPRAPSASRPARFEPAKRLDTGVREASDVVGLPGGRLLVVSDTSDKVAVVDKHGEVTKLELPGLPKNKPSQLEGVAYDPVHHHLIVSREESRELWRYEWNPEKNKAPRLEKKFDVKDLGGANNKGLEGLAWLDGEHSPTGRPQLLGVKEGKPRELLLFDAEGSSRPLRIKLEDQVKDVCKDFSAVTVDPKTGNIFVASDESSTVAQLELAWKGNELRGKLVQVFPLRNAHDEPLARIEGLAFNGKGDLFVLTENNGELHKLERQ